MDTLLGHVTSLSGMRPVFGAFEAPQVPGGLVKMVVRPHDPDFVSSCLGGAPAPDADLVPRTQMLLA